jgi:molybdopterin biosynthesis enzyme
VRATGSDIAAGETVLAAGDVVGPAEVGLAATVGVDSLTVHSLPLVAVLSTGDEVVEAGAEAGEGQVRERERRERGGGEGRDKNTGGPVFNPPRSPHIDP